MIILYIYINGNKCQCIQMNSIACLTRGTKGTELKESENCCYYMYNRTAMGVCSRVADSSTISAHNDGGISIIITTIIIINTF